MKLLAKLFLSRLPVSYFGWHDLGVFKHGHMHESDYAISVSEKHIKRLAQGNSFDGATCVEMGPGDSLGGALVAYSFGAAAIYMVDVGPFARRDIDLYNDIAERLNRAGSRVDIPAPFSDFEDMCQRLNIHYVTSEDPLLSFLPDASVDFIWSNAVLEHIRRKNFAQLISSFSRVLKQSGTMSHRIDYKDHLGGSINNLRFSDELWESDFFSSSGFYTNRLRHCECMTMFKAEGFEVDVLSIDSWDELPLPRSKINEMFQLFDDGDLCVSGADLKIAKVCA